MPTITKTIGTTGRDYSSITSWEADLDNDTPYDAGDDAVGECYNDSAFDEAVTIDGGGTLGLVGVKLTVPEAERHDGTAGTGARIVEGASTSTPMIFMAPGATSVGPVTVEWMELDGNNNVDNTLLAFQNYTSETAGDDVLIKHNIIHDTLLSTGGERHGIGPASGGTVSLGANQKIRCLNNVLYDIGRNAGSGSAANVGIWLDISDVTNKEVAVYNNTVWNVTASGTGSPNGINFGANSANYKLKNNLVANTNTDGSGTARDFGTTAQGGSVDSATNASEDATAPGTGSINTASSSDFVSTTGGSEDFHLASGAVEIDVGTDLGTTPTGVNIDIDGDDRTAVG